MKVGKAIYNILSQSTDVHSNFPFNTTDYAPTGADLVTNGVFSGGAELVTYDDFVPSGGFSEVGGLYVFDDTASGKLNLFNADVIPVTIGATYQVIVNITIASGNANFRFASSNGQLILFNYTDFPNGETTFSATVTGTGTDLQRILALTSSDSPFTLNSISVKESGDDWTLGSGWSIGSNTGLSDGTNSAISQALMTAEVSYKISVTVTGSPTLLVFSDTSFYGDEAARTLLNGTNTYYLKAKAADFSITNEGGDACTITDISVEEMVLTKIFPELAPPDIDAPYIVYSVVSNSPSDTKNANGDIDVASIEVYGFQDTYNKAVDLGVSVRAALDRKTGTYNTIEIQSTNYVNEQMDVNEARKLWAAIQDYSIRIKNI